MPPQNNQPGFKINFKIVALALISFLAFVALLFFIISGISKASSLKAYAQKIEKITTEASSWDEIYFESDIKKLKAELKNVKKKSADYLTSLSETGSTPKTIRLKNYLIEYITLHDKIANDEDEYLRWRDELEDLMAESDNFGLGATVTNDSKAKIKEIREDLKDNREKIRLANVGDQLTDQKKLFLAVYDPMIAMYDKIILGLESNNVATILTVAADSAVINENYAKIKKPKDFIEENFDADFERLKSLKKNIETEVEALKSTNFALSV